MICTLYSPLLYPVLLLSAAWGSRGRLRNQHFLVQQAHWADTQSTQLMSWLSWLSECLLKLNNEQTSVIEYEEGKHNFTHKVSPGLFPRWQPPLLLLSLLWSEARRQHKPLWLRVQVHKTLEWPLYVKVHTYVYMYLCTVDKQFYQLKVLRFWKVPCLICHCANV